MIWCKRKGSWFQYKKKHKVKEIIVTIKKQLWGNGTECAWKVGKTKNKRVKEGIALKPKSDHKGERWCGKLKKIF